MKALAENLAVKTKYADEQGCSVRAAEPNQNWCVGCSPDNCSGCGTFYEIKKQRDELRTQLAAAQEEMNDWRNQAHQSQSAFDRLQDQLAKAEQLWQVAQGRCDGLEEKLAKAEQRVAALELEVAEQRVAALELEVARLRSVMADVIKAHGYAGGTPIEAISTPITPAALNELIEKVEKRTIDRCCVELKRLDYWYSAAAIIRLPTGQIKLEELL